MYLKCIAVLIFLSTASLSAASTEPATPDSPSIIEFNKEEAEFAQYLYLRDQLNNPLTAEQRGNIMWSRIGDTATKTILTVLIVAGLRYLYQAADGELAVARVYEWATDSIAVREARPAAATPTARPGTTPPANARRFYRLEESTIESWAKNTEVFLATLATIPIWSLLNLFSLIPNKYENKRHVFILETLIKQWGYHKQNVPTEFHAPLDALSDYYQRSNNNFELTEVEAKNLVDTIRTICDTHIKNMITVREEIEQLTQATL